MRFVADVSVPAATSTQRSLSLVAENILSGHGGLIARDDIEIFVQISIEIVERMDVQVILLRFPSELP